MKIEKDIVTFDDADFVGLSDLAKKAVPPYSGTTPFPEFVGKLITDHISTAKKILKEQTVTTDVRTDEIISGLAEADPAKLAAAEQCLVDLQAILKSK